MEAKFTSESRENKSGNIYVQCFVALLANTCLLTFGLQTGWISPMTKLLQSKDSPTGESVTDGELSLIGSVMCLSAALSVSLYSYLADRYGRKFCIILICFLQTITWIIKLSATNTTMLIISRVVCGIATGGCYNIVPIYTKEISEDNIRGILGSLLMMFYNTGVLMMYIMGSLLPYYTVLWIVTWIPLIVGTLMIKAPESPSFLVTVGEIDKATSTVAYLRGLEIDDKRVLEEINQMKSIDLYYKSLPDISSSSVFRNRIWRRCFFLILALITAQAFNGNFAIIIYASSMLEAMKVTVDPDLQTMSFPAVMILGSLISMSLVERTGRKALLVFTFAFCVLSMTCIGVSLLVVQYDIIVPTWLTVASIVVSAFMYALGACPLPYIIMVEILNFQIRVKVIGWIVTYSWLVSFTQLSTFASMSNALGMHTTFFFYAAVSLFGVYVCLAHMPETKGKSVEQIENEIGGKK